MNICIITQHYPSVNDPTFAFVETLVCAWVDLGHCCTVVAPQSILSSIKNNRVIRKIIEIRKAKGGNEYILYSPRVPSLSQIPFFHKAFFLYERKRYFNVVKKVIDSIEPKPEILYGHFVHSGMLAARLGSQYGIPSFVAFGESSLKDPIKYYGIDRIKEELTHLSGAISVSSQLKKEVLSLKILPKIPVLVIPNAVDDTLFYPLGKEERNRKREQLGINLEDFVIAFVGYFNERKGPHRVMEAIKGLDGVKGLFLGSGPNKPVGKQVAYCGTVDHQKLPEYLNCADVFVLPTLAEGCCNAIIEALACGLPVISSNMPFNDDILDNSYAIRVNPQSVAEIADAILFLKNNPQIRETMSQEVLNIAKKFAIEERAKRILYNICIQNSTKEGLFL